MDSFELVEGRTVLLQIAEGEYRPATVVKVFTSPCANLVVFLDGQNDDRHDLATAGVWGREPGSCTGWATSRIRGEAVGQWITPQELISLRAQA